MIIFSTKLPVKSFFDKRIFMNLVVEWNQKSPYDAIPQISWDKESYDNRWEDVHRELETLEYEDIVAARFSKDDENGVTWTTEFVFHENKKEIGIYLSREANEDTIFFPIDFKPPYLVKMLIRNGYIADDNELPVTDENISMKCVKGDLTVLENLINDTGLSYKLPIVYLTKRWNDNQYILDIKQLAWRLQGVAHVLIEDDSSVSQELKNLCKGRNVYNGGISVFYPSLSAETRNYIPIKELEPARLLEKIIRKIYLYMNQQKRERLDTWDGIQYLKEKQERERLFGERKEFEKTKKENQDVWEELQKADRKIKELSSRINKLTNENAVLNARIDSMGEIPLLYYGEEKDFYQDEIKEFVLSAVEEKIQRLPLDTKGQSIRVADVLRDILDANDFDHIQKQRFEMLKQALHGYQSLTDEIRNILIDLGFKITSDGRHHKLTYYDDDRYVITMSKSGSDNRAGDNLASEIRRKIFY